MRGVDLRHDRRRGRRWATAVVAAAAILVELVTAAGPARGQPALTGAFLVDKVLLGDTHCAVR